MEAGEAMKPNRSAIKTDLFSAQIREAKVDRLGDPLPEIASQIDFGALAAEVDRIAPRPSRQQGGRPPFPTETMVRILVLKRLYNLSDEQMEYQLLDRMDAGPGVAQSDPAQGRARQTAVGLPAATQQPHRQDTSTRRTRLWCDQADGRQAHPNDRPGACGLCDDDDGRLLQPQAVGVFQTGRH